MTTKYVVQRYRVRSEDGQKFVLLRSECRDNLAAQARLAALATEDPTALYEVVTESDDVPAYVPPTEPQINPLKPKRTRLRELRARGWPSLTAAEQAEVQQLTFEVGS